MLVVFLKRLSLLLLTGVTNICPDVFALRDLTAGHVSGLWLLRFVLLMNKVNCCG